jgi:L-fucose isomerase-like protein
MMSRNSSGISARIGFVPTYRFRYSDWCRELHERCLAVLRSTEGLELVTLGEGATAEQAVHRLDEAEVAVRVLREAEVDALVVCPLDFGDERSVAKVAEGLKVPVLLFATSEPPARDDPGMGRMSDSYCGNLSIASAFHRRGIRFRFAGVFLPEDEGLKSELNTFTRAVAVVAGLTGARIGQVGVRTPSFETVMYDEAALIRKFGQNVIFRNVSDISVAAKAIEDNDPQLRDTLKQIRKEAAQITVPDESVKNAARLECALTRFYEQEKLSVMAVQCWPSLGREMGVEVCSTLGRLTGRHMLTACETDVLGGLSMLANHRAALGSTVPHFIDWTIKHREHPNRFLAWHCGNAPVCLAADPKAVALRSRSNMKGVEERIEGSRGCLFQFQLKPGPVTICRIAQYGARWRMLIARGTIVQSEETLAGTWGWVEVTDHDRLYRTLVEEGFIHHASMIHGDQAGELQRACELADIEPVVVD